MYLSAFTSPEFTSVALDSRLPGTWKLEAARAIALHASQDAQLCIAHGRVWLTFDRADASRTADHFLQAGEQLHVARGQRVVLESFGSDRHAPAYFSWCAVAAQVAPPVRAISPWQVSVVQPLADLRGAVGQGLVAAARVLLGLVLTGTWIATNFIAGRAVSTRAAGLFDAKTSPSCTP